MRHQKLTREDIASAENIHVTEASYIDLIFPQHIVACIEPHAL